MFKIVPKKLIEIEQKKPEFYLEDFMPIPKSALTLLSANGGSGKSFLSIQLAIRLTQDEKHKALLWLSEDPAGLSKHRAEEIINKIENVGKHLKNIDIIDDMPPYITEANYNHFKELFLPYNLIVLDPLIAFFGGEENSNSQARFFMNMLNKMVRENKQSFLIIHHSTKGTKEQESRSRGASAFIDAVRLSYEIKIIENENTKREVVVNKDNFGVKQFFGESKVIKILPFEVIYKPEKNEAKEQKETVKKDLWEVI